MSINSMNTVFISHGSNGFDPDRFSCVKNQPTSIFVDKPTGGLWVSPFDSEYGWEDWCRGAGRKQGDKDYWGKSFQLVLTKKSRVLEIVNECDIVGAPHTSDGGLDFEKLSTTYDAILLTHDGVVNTTGRIIGYNCELGWDCESMLIMNKHCIVPYKSNAI